MKSPPPASLRRCGLFDSARSRALNSSSRASPGSSTGIGAGGASTTCILTPPLDTTVDAAAAVDRVAGSVRASSSRLRY
jgi:hypothetical protein